jgi:hypothetical protein
MPDVDPLVFDIGFWRRWPSASASPTQSSTVSMRVEAKNHPTAGQG